MTDLTQQIARLEKLDAERTPRFWMQELVKYHQIRDFGGALIAQTLLPRGDERVDKANAEFIAAAPEMMAVIREQQRLLGLAVEALERVQHQAGYIHVALAEPAKKNPVCASLRVWSGGIIRESETTLAQLKPTEEV